MKKKHSPKSDASSPSTTSVTVVASATDARLHPAWLTMVALALSTFKNFFPLEKLAETASLTRGREGFFTTIDFLIPLLGYTVSNGASLKAWLEEAGDWIWELSSLWMRVGIPSRSAISRFLADVTPEFVNTWRDIFFLDLLKHGLQGENIGYIKDILGERHIVFDADGTRDGHILRDLPSDNTRPPPRRRAQQKPGYAGRTRADEIRTRWALFQAHTAECLSLWAEAGNGLGLAVLPFLQQRIAAYMEAHAMPLVASILRLDGELGKWQAILQLQKGPGAFIGRCSLYDVLKENIVIEAMAAQTPALFFQPESGLTREVFDLSVSGPGLSTPIRLLITRTPARRERHRVGKRKGKFIYEIFATTLDPLAFPPREALSLYFGRASVENFFACEDRELPTEHWISFHGPGQDFEHLICMWVWNWKVAAGHAIAPKLQETRWDLEAVPSSVTQRVGADGPAAETGPSEKGSESPDITASGMGVLPLESGVPVQTVEPLGIFEASADAQPSAQAMGVTVPGIPTAPPSVTEAQSPAPLCFHVEAGQVRCPAGHVMRQSEILQTPGKPQARYALPGRLCHACPLQSACRGLEGYTPKGRRVRIDISDLTESHTLPKHIVAKLHFKHVVLDKPKQRVRPREGMVLTEAVALIQGPVTLEMLESHVESRRNRARLKQALWNQRASIAGHPVKPLPVPPGPRSRSERAHRRQRWRERWNKSALLDTGFQMQLHGITRSLALYCGIPYNGC